MLDALKGLGGGKAQKQSDDLQSLISAAKEERSALSAMLTQISMRSVKLTQMGKSLEQVDQKAASASEKLDVLNKRIDTLEQQTKSFGETEKRVQGLIEAATSAQQAGERLMAPDGELQKHRRQVQQLSSQALETQASVDAIKKERAALEEFRTQLRQSQNEIKQSVDHASSLRGELDQVRSTAAQLAQDYGKLRETSRAAREDSLAATEAVKEAEKKLGPLMQLQELSKTTDEKLTSLNALAEHVSQKAKALESQKHTIDRASVEANRLNEMVWSMDVQIGKLNEGMKQAARTEETVARIEKLVEETNGKVDTAAKVRDEFAREAARMEKDGRALVDVMRTYVEKLALEKKEFEAFDQRLRALQGSVHEAESRMEALSTKERHLSQMNQQVDGLSKDFQALMSQADELSKKQANLETLQAALAQVDELSKRTLAQYDSLKQSRADVDKLRNDIHEFHKSHAEADGRHSIVRERAGLAVTNLGAPIDVLWMRLSKKPGDPGQTLGRINYGRMLVTLDRGDYWQCAFVIRKGGFDAVRERGLASFQGEIVRIAPFLADRVLELRDWDDVKLLTVAVDRLERWWRPGLLCIGDCAHAMSPIGGVGINLAIQDAVAAANILAGPLRASRLTDADLEAVQRRRTLPTRLTQAVQIAIQRRVLDPVIGRDEPITAPWLLRLFNYLPWLARVPARLMGIGFRPEHVLPLRPGIAARPPA